MRILKLSDVYFPRINGVSTSISTFRREFLSMGHEVTLVAPRYDSISHSEADIIRVPARAIPMDPEDRLLRWNALQRQTRHFSPGQFDVLHIHTPFVAHYAGLKLARRLGIPTVETYHTYFEEYLHNYVTWLPRQALRTIARGFSRSQCDQVDAVVVPSHPMRHVLESYGVRTPMEVIPTGIDTRDLGEGDGMRFRAHHRIPPERPTLVHVGRIAFEKNIEFLIQVLERIRRDIPDVLLIIAGEGPARDHLKTRVTQKGLDQNVLFVGYLPRGPALADCYRSGDGFVFASRTETQGLVLLEAMSLGVPVVSTAVLGTRDVLRDGQGCLIANDDLDDFSTKTMQLLQTPHLRQSLAESALAYAKRWDARSMAQRMIDLYQQTRQLAAAPDEAGSPIIK